MKIIIPLVILALVALVLFVAPKLMSQNLPMKFYEAKIQDVRSVVKMLKDTGSNESYVIFVFNSSRQLPDSHIELQFSIEKNTLGFDWVLLGEEKTRDVEDFGAMATRYGMTVMDLKENNVEYLRITDGDIVSLCETIMREIYMTEEKQPMEVIAKNFKVIGFPFSTE